MMDLFMLACMTRTAGAFPSVFMAPIDINRGRRVHAQVGEPGRPVLIGRLLPAVPRGLA